VGKAKKNTPKPRKRGKARTPPTPKEQAELAAPARVYWEVVLPRSLGEFAEPNPPAVPVPLKSAKEWIPELVKPVHDKLLAIGTTGASRWLALHPPPDGKPVKPRSAEKILRNCCGFPKANRGQRAK
jgi:hypothetical protein